MPQRREISSGSDDVPIKVSAEIHGLDRRSGARWLG